MRTHDRLAILGQRSALAPALLRACAAPGSAQVRLIAPWGEARPQALDDALVGVELITYNPGDFESLRRAMRACNALVLLSEPGGALSSSVRHVRHVAQACRDSEVERMVLVSCASLLGVHRGQWLRHEAGDPPPVSSPLMRWRHMIELERARFAADAMDIVGLYPGLVWMPEHPAFVQAVRGAPSSAQTSVISSEEVARMCLVALEQARAGHRYGLGMCNVGVKELIARLPGAPPGEVIERALVRANRARFSEPLRVQAVLDTRRAQRELGLRVVASLNHMLDA
jgi:nucleoside-diphosphate-sugar epimerase